MVEGFLLVDKPSGPTSHDLVTRVRRLSGVRKVGHAGTLDPMATGLLVVAIGRVTRLIRFVQATVKEYIATMVLGVATDTLDADGAVLSREPLPVFRDEVVSATRRFVGDIHQIPPMVSAVKIGGRRLYEMARAGETIERPPRPVRIDEIDIIDFVPGQYPEVVFRVICSTGTYVRTLADDIAGVLGGRAHLSVLRRTAMGTLRVEDAHDVFAMEAVVDGAGLQSLMVAPIDALRDLPMIEVGPDVARGVSHGALFSLAALGLDGSGDGPHRVVGPDADLIAVYEVGERSAKPAVVLA